MLGPDRIGQALYNLAQKISHLQYGWLILLGLLGLLYSLCTDVQGVLIPFLVAISFPPCIGHSTVCTLCGFAYGMRGLPLAACGTLLGASLCFIVLRFLFSHRLHEWSASNEKWQALETVVVRLHDDSVIPCLCMTAALGCKGSPVDLAHSCIAFPPLGVFERTIRCKPLVQQSPHMPYEWSRG